MRYEDKILYIHKFLCGELDDRQRVDFELWLAENEDNKLAFDQIATVWAKATPITKENFDATSAFKKHLHKIEVENIVSRRKDTNNIFSLINLRAIAAIFVLLVVSSFAFLWINQQQVYVAENQSIAVQLEDGTSVQLFQGSSISVSRFIGFGRNVSLIGKAYFDVAKDDANPFVIQAENLHVKVVGTKFILDSKSNEVKVQEGKVVVSNLFKDKISLTANQEVVLTSDNKLDITDVAFDTAFLLFNEELKFDNASLDNVFKDISTKFNVNFILPKNKDLTSCKFTSGALKNNSIDQILSTLKLTFDLEYIKLDSNTIQISKISCK